MSEYSSSNAEISRNRDEKVRSHLAQYAPVWMIDDHIVAEHETATFNVLFRHPRAGLNESEAWVSRRYRYDSFNNVLHHRGQNIMDDDAVLEIIDKTPYLDNRGSNIANSYGG